MRLHLGCGPLILEGWVNMDSQPWPGVDIVRDALRGLPFSDGAVEEIFSENFLEHIPQAEVIWMMNEMHRVMHPGGSMKHVIPQYGTRADIGDPTHLSRWSMETLTYFEHSHGHNAYYAGRIKPWVINVQELGLNKVLDVHFRPWHP